MFSGRQNRARGVHHSAAGRAEVLATTLPHSLPQGTAVVLRILQVLLQVLSMCVSTEKPPRSAADAAQQPAVSDDCTPRRRGHASGHPWLSHRRHHQAAAARQPGRRHRPSERTHRHGGSGKNRQVTGQQKDFCNL